MNEGVSEDGAGHTSLDSWPLGCWPQALAAWAVLVCAPGYYSAPPAAVSALWAAASAPPAAPVHGEKPKSREKVNWYPHNTAQHEACLPRENFSREGRCTWWVPHKNSGSGSTQGTAPAPGEHQNEGLALGCTNQQMPEHQTFCIKDKNNWGFCRTKPSNFTWHAYQIDDIDLSQGKTIPALRVSLPVHGQPSELGERIKTCPQENAGFEIIL